MDANSTFVIGNQNHKPIMSNDVLKPIQSSSSLHNFPEMKENRPSMSDSDLSAHLDNRWAVQQNSITCLKIAADSMVITGSADSTIKVLYLCY